MRTTKRRLSWAERPVNEDDAHNDTHDDTHDEEMKVRGKGIDSHYNSSCNSDANQTLLAGEGDEIETLLGITPMYSSSSMKKHQYGNDDHTVPPTSILGTGRKERRLSWADLTEHPELSKETKTLNSWDGKSINDRFKRRNSEISRISVATYRNVTSSKSPSDSGGCTPSGLISNTLNCIQDDEIGTDTILERKKSRSIWCLRTLTLTTLTAAALIVALLTYTYSRGAEMKVFKTQYQDSVVKVSEAISLDINNKLNTAMSFSAMYTSRYGPEDSWPNVTMPNFQEQARGQLAIADGIAISFNPIITNETKAGWEAHAVESVNILGEEKVIERVKNGIRPNMTQDIIEASESRYPDHMVPVWQIYPIKINWKAVMFDLHSEINRQRALDDMLENEVPTITGLLHLVQHDEMDPSSILFFPVFNHLDKSEFFRRVEGSISIVFTWADILRSVLPGYIKGLIVVLESSVSDELDNQQFTYSISGGEVTLIGEGDRHDVYFDDYEHVVFANVAQDAENLGTVDYLIMYELRIYPSMVFQEQYLTKQPLIMTIVVMFIFILTCVIFLIYDYLVHNRQNAIMTFAQRSGRIVNSMFPSGVQERLFSSNEQLERQTICDTNAVDEKDKDDGTIRSGSTTSRNPKHHIKKFLKGNSSKSSSTKKKANIQGYIQNTPPIADLFKNTTIMFADMVSFTAWSSKHSPEDVFYLLETLFLEFDKVAEQKGVFKLGTIGDCYIAVTGVPDIRDDHAVVLAEFAEECRIKTNQVISQLAEEFGPSVNTLSMRFGLHSGAVTAGVLRGAKCRFELFGDTMNTASRMESTGTPNKIQISNETAKQLTKRGYGSWLFPREELVHAKGKGLLQTYWLEINGTDGIDSLRRLPIESTTGTLSTFDKTCNEIDVSSNDGIENKSLSYGGCRTKLCNDDVVDDIVDDIDADSMLSQCSSSSSIIVEKDFNSTL